MTDLFQFLPYSPILAMTIKANVIKTNGYTNAKPFFTINLYYPQKGNVGALEAIEAKVTHLRTPIGFATSEHMAFRYSTFVYYLDRLG